jgi:hypothetical protein
MGGKVLFLTIAFKESSSGSDLTSGSVQTMLSQLDAEYVIRHLSCVCQTPQIFKSKLSAQACGSSRCFYFDKELEEW